MGFNTFDEKIPDTAYLQLTDSLGTNIYFLQLSSITNTYRIDALTCTTDSAADLHLMVGLGSQFDSPHPMYPIETVVIPLGSGNGTVPAFDVLAHLPAPYQQGIPFMPGGGLVLQLVTALATGAHLWLTALGGEL